MPEEKAVWSEDVCTCELAQFRTELSDEATRLLELLDRQDRAALEPEGAFLQRAAEFADGAEKLLLRLREKEGKS